MRRHESHHILPGGGGAVGCLSLDGSPAEQAPCCVYVRTILVTNTHVMSRLSFTKHVRHAPLTRHHEASDVTFDRHLTPKMSCVYVCACEFRGGGLVRFVFVHVFFVPVRAQLSPVVL